LPRNHRPAITGVKTTYQLEKRVRLVYDFIVFLDGR
jgi:hypothetical protein